MALYLVELQPSTPERTSVEMILSRIATVLSAATVELVEAHVPSSFRRLFLIAEGRTSDAVGEALIAADIEFDDISEVRLVGDKFKEIKKLARDQKARYLVEWDLPAGLSMDSYLKRKAEKSQLYRQVPETTFLRTYVREDLGKCICLYNAPDESAVRRARDVVDAPIDRIHNLDNWP